MNRLFKFRYWKLTLLLIFSVLSYFIFSNSNVQDTVNHLNSLSYLGIFIAGLLFSFGFTTPFAIGFFFTIRPESILLAALVGGCGALISDLLIFKLIRFSFMDEFYRLEKTKIMSKVIHEFHHDFNKKIRVYLLYIFAGIIISSPLPDELGVSMLAGLTKISTPTLAIISLVMNTLGIMIMLFISSIRFI
jgi:hypothetical protein